MGPRSCEAIGSVVLSALGNSLSINVLASSSHSSRSPAVLVTTVLNVRR